MLKISIGIGTQQGRTQDTTPGGFDERITFATFQRSGRAYQQLPPSIPNPGSRKPNSTYQSLSTRFRKTILKAFPSKSIGAPGLESNRLIIRDPTKKGRKERAGERGGEEKKGRATRGLEKARERKGERKQNRGRKGVRMIASYRLQSESLRSYGYLLSRRPRKSRQERPKPTKEAKKKRDQGRIKIEKKRHRVCVARGASPFLIESRLRAYILSSIGTVGSVSAG